MDLKGNRFLIIMHILLNTIISVNKIYKEGPKVYLYRAEKINDRRRPTTQWLFLKILLWG